MSQSQHGTPTIFAKSSPPKRRLHSASARRAFSSARHFAPATLPNLQDQAQCELALSEAVEQVYSSKRTLSAIQSVLSPENAPSDMTVLPVLGNTVPHSTSTYGSLR
jgi:hypothetical protein